jgi:hypothetical protein
MVPETCISTANHALAQEQAVGGQEQAGEVRGTGVESGDLQESEVIKVDDWRQQARN